MESDCGCGGQLSLKVELICGESKAPSYPKTRALELLAYGYASNGEELRSEGFPWCLTGRLN
jgi:hypothetical protein